MPRKELNPADFDRTHGDGLLSRLRSLLSDSHNTYKVIRRRFGISRQRVGQLARKMAIDGRKRERQRNLRKLVFSDSTGYSDDV
jgi:hypothetical protein